MYVYVYIYVYICILLRTHFGCINSITEFEVVGQRGRGRPRKTWKDTINNDLRRWKLLRADPANRMEWRKKLRTNIGAVRPTLSGTDTLNE